jgi:signal transduction histidine kinase
VSLFSGLQAGIVLVACAGLLVVWLAAGTAHARARRRARHRERLLTRVVETESLQPQGVLEAAVAGLADYGLDRVRIHRPQDGPGSTGAGHADEFVFPLGADGTAACLRVGRTRGRITREQRHAATVLAEQAGAAFERALRFDEGQRLLRDLQTVEAQAQDFVSTVSHELRTPLAAVQGLAQTLARRWEALAAPQRADLAVRIDANAQRLQDMVRSLLASSALDEGRLQVRWTDVRLRTLVVELCSRLAELTEAYPVRVEVDAELRVRADAGLLTHVFENLLGNVARHTPPGTRVQIGAVRRGDEVRISVSDDGPGIAAPDLPHVLDRFYRGGDRRERHRRGLGLGLALAAQIVEAHGARLEVAAEEGRGATFWWSLPAADEPPVTSGASDARSGR